MRWELAEHILGINPWFSLKTRCCTLADLEHIDADLAPPSSSDIIDSENSIGYAHQECPNADVARTISPWYEEAAIAALYANAVSRNENFQCF